jgi:hypothetical protein
VGASLIIKQDGFHLGIFDKIFAFGELTIPPNLLCLSTCDDPSKCDVHQTPLM